MVADSGTYDEATRLRRAKIAEALYTGNKRPVQHFTQGLADMANAYVGGSMLKKLDDDAKASEEAQTKAYLGFLNGGDASSPSATPPISPAQPAITPPVPSAPVNVPSATAPVASARPEVMPSNRVWGDKEAQAAGLYDAPGATPTAPSAPVVPPQPNVRVAQAMMPTATDASSSNAPPKPPVAEVRPIATDSTKARIAQMLQDPNPAVRKMGRSLTQQLIVQQMNAAMKPAEYDYKDDGKGGFFAINKKNPSDIRQVEGDSKGAIQFNADKAAAEKAAILKAERDATAPQRQAQEQQVANIVTQDIDRAIREMDSATLPTTGQIGSWLSNIGGTAAGNVRALVDTVKANAGFQELNKMRQASPTGGALGNITERELSLLQATIGNLEQSQSADQFKDNLRRVKNVYLDIIHGAGKGPPRETLSFKEQPGKAGQRKTKSGISWSVE